MTDDRQRAVVFLTHLATVMDDRGEPWGGAIRQAVRVLLIDNPPNLCGCGCGQELTGRATRWASDACRKRSGRR